ncbi:MAG TPA: DUF4184 family protein [Terracidiphilus sp.]|nr:DUF4184 family protein [Terracidiphilus sp.]
MPFTLSHPAAAIPFLRTRLVPSALVIGCMAPDFEYFLHFAPGGGFGHTLAGVFLFDLPAAFIVLWLFHVYAKDPLYAWLPGSVRRRIRLGPAALPVRNIAQLALVLLSILVGVATHILWDSFTHPNYWPYRHWQFLHRTAELPLYGPMGYVRVLQYGSTVFGAAVLLLWFWSWFRRTTPVEPEKATYPRMNHRGALFVISIAALIAAVLRGVVFPEFMSPDDVPGRTELLARAVIAGMDIFWVGVVAYGAWRARARSKLQDA